MDSASGSSESAGQTYTALVVMDAAESVQLAAVLEHLGLKVLSTLRGDEALDLFYTTLPDLVVLDEALPDCKGWDVVNAIRDGRPTGKDPAFIFDTRYHDPANLLMARLQGVSAYLKKPVQPEMFEQAVIGALRLQGG